MNGSTFQWSLVAMVLAGGLIPAVRAEILIDDLDAPTAWSGTAEKRTVGPEEAKVGAGALGMKIGEGATDAPLALTRELDQLDLSQADVLTFWVQASGPFDSLQVRLRDRAGTTAENSVLHFQRMGEAETWYWVVWPYRLYSGRIHGSRYMRWSEIAGLTFSGSGPAPPGAVQFTLDDLRAMSLREAWKAVRADPEKAVGNRWLLWSVRGYSDPEVQPHYLRQQAEWLAQGYDYPATLQELSSWQERLRHRLWRSLRLEKVPPCPLEPQVLSTLNRDGYRVERVIFQTWPGVFAPANVYVPTAGEGPFPAVLLLPGTSDRLFAGGYQRMGQRFAREGYVFMFVETFGTGERSIQETLNDYPEGAPAGLPWVVGQPLSGVVIYDYQRALDYLVTRPEVDSERIGATGASAGGVHSLWLGALDPRVQAVVPVASGWGASTDRYHQGQIWSGIPGQVLYTDENGIVGATAPRPLLWIHLTGDESQTEKELRRKAAPGQKVYDLAGASEAFELRLVESPHGYFDYLQEMALEWFNRWLQGRETLPPEEGWEPTYEPAETLACWLQDGRPPVIKNYYDFFLGKARQLVDRIGPPPDSMAQWKPQARRLKNRLRRVLKIPRTHPPVRLKTVGISEFNGQVVTRLSLETEPGLSLPLVTLRTPAPAPPSQAILLLHPEGKLGLAENPLTKALVAQGYLVALFEPRFTGETRWAGEAGAFLELRDHRLCQATVKLGRPALGMWVQDLQKARQALAEAESIRTEDIALGGWQEMGLAALFTAALADSPSTVVGINVLGSYYGPQGYGRLYSWGQDNRNLGGIGSLAPMVPDILTVGDIPQFASLLSPGRLLLCQPWEASGKAMTQEAATENFLWTRRVFDLEGAGPHFSLTTEVKDQEILQWLGG